VWDVPRSDPAPHATVPFEGVDKQLRLIGVPFGVTHEYQSGHGASSRTTARDMLCP
jgi:hypothetical protein